MHFEVTLRRPTVTIALKLFLPLLLILAGLIALYLPPDLVDARASIGVTALLACFAFQFTVAGTIPDVVYLTIADVLFIIGYAVTTLALLETVIVLWLHRKQRDVIGHRVDVATRILLPALTVLSTVAFTRPKPPVEHHIDTRFPKLEQFASARKLVRVGASQLPTANTGLLNYATRWALVQELATGQTIPFSEYTVPSVESDALRVLANGHFQVRWHLRANTRWSDGAALTSDDLRFALEVSPDPRVLQYRNTRRPHAAAYIP